jgi:PAS domain S-box-containing protein
MTKQSHMDFKGDKAHPVLQKDEHNYREMVNNSNCIIIKWDCDGRLLFYNDYSEKIFGYSADEILGRNIIGTIVPETESSGRNLIEMIRNITLNPEVYLNNENENICKNGQRVWISWNNRALNDIDGKRLGILSIGQDITARIKVEQELRKSEERFRSFVENANDVVFALTPTGIFSYVSPRWKDAFGYDISETIGHPFVPFVHPDDVQGCFEFLQKVIITGEKQSGVEYRVRCKDGRFLWYKANGSLIQDSENNTVTFLGIGRDITERKFAEEALCQSEAKFSAAFQASPDAISLTRLKDGICLDVNEGFTTLTGYVPDEVIGKSTVDLKLWDNPLERKQLVKNIELHGMINDMTVKIRRKDGVLRTGQVYGRVIEIGGMPSLFSIVRDITEHEYLQQELIKAQKLESISILAGGIAHNFNNVLTGVIGYISYAKKHLKEPDKVLPILESAEKSTYRAADLARQLLTFSQGSTPVRRPVIVDTLVQESVSLFLSGTNVKGNIDCSSHQTIHVDSQLINQAFNNIVINALQAMPDGGTLTVQSETVTLQAGNKYALQPATYVQIIFTDTGCGIKKDDLPKLFDPYFTTKEYGTGLGLSTTHSIINKHGGYIDVLSEIDKGTTVTIILPTTTEVQPGHECMDRPVKIDPENI